MDENEKVMDESREMMEELCGPSAAAVESAVEDEAAANAEMESFCDAAEALISATTEVPVLSERTENASCQECKEKQAKALLSEMALRHEAELRRDQALAHHVWVLDEKKKVESERDAALAERDARVLDEQVRAQRVDIEALRTKVELMKKNLIAVDARADERFDEALREKDRSCERRVAELLETERASVRGIVEKATADMAPLSSIRAGEAVRVEAINTAMETIWATGRRDKGAPKNDRELVVALTQILSVGRLHAQ